MFDLLQEASWAFFFACPILPFMAMMMVGCCCCIVFEDDFATDKLATDYNLRSGSATVSGNVLTTSSSNLLLISTAQNSSGKGRSSVTGKVSVTGGRLRAVGSYVDDNNHLFAEITINGVSSTLKLWKKVSGVDTQIGLTQTFSGSLNTDYTANLCWNGSKASADSGANVCHGAYSGTGTQAGIGANAAGGVVTIDSYSFKKHPDEQAGCSTCVQGCSGDCCLNKPEQQAYVIEFADLTDNCGGMTWCASRNGEYILQQPNHTICVWQYTLITSATGYACVAFAHQCRTVMSLSLLSNPCKWRLTGGFSVSSFVPGVPTEESSYVYEGTPPSGDCTAEVVLSLVSQTLSPNYPCNLPSTVTLRSP